MRRHEESHSFEMDRAIELGEENLKCISGMKQWCTHFQVELKHYGLFAEVTGLPIGSHEIGCQYAHGSESANLRWICSDFLIEHCDGCPHHTTNGNTQWAEEIISEHHERVRVAEALKIEQDTRVSQLREELRAESKAIESTSAHESKRIAGLFESMFSEEEGTADESAEFLRQSAAIAPDLFPNASIDLLVSLARTKEYRMLVVPICQALAGSSNDIDEKLRDVALDNIGQGFNVEDYAAILNKISVDLKFPLDRSVVAALILSQHHARPIGGWRLGPPDYTNTTSVLVQCFDADCQSVEDVIRDYLFDKQDYVRSQVCGAINLIQKTRPELVLHLLEALKASLELSETNVDGTSPSSTIVRILCSAFILQPRLVNDFISSCFSDVRPTVQEDLLKVYRQALLKNEDRFDDTDPIDDTSDFSDVESIAIRQLMDWISNDSIEIDIRSHAAEVLEVACDFNTESMIKQFDSLLGYYATLSELPNPPSPPPKIILPGAPDDPQLAELNNFRRMQDWGIFKRRIATCLKDLAKLRPQDTFESIDSCLSRDDIHLGEVFRSLLVSLIGIVGNDFNLRPRVLPHLMKALMNYDSNLVRANAIEASIAAFSDAQANPPSNIVEALFVHSRDPVVIVHQAAINAIERRPQWYSHEQVRGILISFSFLLKAYKNEPFQIKDICDAILSLGRRHGSFMPLCIKLVVYAYPTNQELVNSHLASSLMRACAPGINLRPMFQRSLPTI